MRSDFPFHAVKIAKSDPLPKRQAVGRARRSDVHHDPSKWLRASTHHREGQGRRVWPVPNSERHAFGGTKTVPAGGRTEQILLLDRGTGVTRLRVEYYLVMSPRQAKIDDRLLAFHIHFFGDAFELKQLLAPSFEVPLR